MRPLGLSIAKVSDANQVRTTKRTVIQSRTNIDVPLFAGI
jgi:hypothetical protein